MIEKEIIEAVVSELDQEMNAAVDEKVRRLVKVSKEANSLTREIKEIKERHVREVAETRNTLK